MHLKLLRCITLSLIFLTVIPGNLTYLNRQAYLLYCRLIAPQNVTVGETFTIQMNVSLISPEYPVAEVTAQLNVLDEGVVEIVGGPQPQTADLTESSWTVFSWTAVAKAPGTARIEGTATGISVLTEEQVVSEPCRTTVIVVSPPTSPTPTPPVEAAVDLSCMEITANNTAPAQGEPFRVQAVIQATGNITATFNLTFSLGPLQGGYILGNLTRTLSPGETCTVWVDLIINQTGEYEIHLYIDPENQVIETNEENNHCNITIIIPPVETTTPPPPPPSITIDLFCLGIAVTPQKPQENQIFDISVTVGAEGTTQPIPQFQVKLLLIIDHESQELGVQNVNMPGPGRKEVRFKAKIQSSGNYTLKAMIDPANMIVETNENNNECSLGITVYPPTAPTTTPTPPISPTTPSPQQQEERKKIVTGAIIIGIIIGIIIEKLIRRKFYPPIPLKMPKATCCCLKWWFNKDGNIEVNHSLQRQKEIITRFRTVVEGEKGSLTEEKQVTGEIEAVVPYGGYLPLVAAAVDKDYLIVECREVDCDTGKTVSKQQVKIPLPDIPVYRWEIVKGRGSFLTNPQYPHSHSATAEGPAVVYVAPPPPTCNNFIPSRFRKYDEKRDAYGEFAILRSEDYPLEEEIIIRLTVDDLQRKVEELDDPAGYKPVEKILKIKVTDNIDFVELEHERRREAFPPRGSVEEVRQIPDKVAAVYGYPTPHMLISPETSLKEKIADQLPESEDKKQIVQLIDKIKKAETQKAYLERRLRTWRSILQDTLFLEEEQIESIRKAVEKEIEELKNAKQQIEDLNAKVQGLIQKQVETQYEGKCNLKVKWLSPPGIEADITFPAKNQKLTLHPGQTVIFKAAGKDTDTLQIICGKKEEVKYSEGESQQNPKVENILFNDRLFFHWEAEWVDKPDRSYTYTKLRKLARYRILKDMVKKIGLPEGAAILRDFEDKARVRMGADENLEEELENNVLYYYPNLKRKLEKYKAAELPKHMQRLNQLIERQVKLIDLIDDVIGPSEFVLTTNGETVIFKAPYSRGKIRVRCKVRDSGIQAPDGEAKIERIIEVKGKPYIEHLYEILTRLEKAKEKLELMTKENLRHTSIVEEHGGEIYWHPEEVSVERALWLSLFTYVDKLPDNITERFIENLRTIMRGDKVEVVRRGRECTIKKSEAGKIAGIPDAIKALEWMYKHFNIILSRRIAELSTPTLWGIFLWFVGLALTILGVIFPPSTLIGFLVLSASIGLSYFTSMPLDIAPMGPVPDPVLGVKLNNNIEILELSVSGLEVSIELLNATRAKIASYIAKELYKIRKSKDKPVFKAIRTKDLCIVGFMNYRQLLGHAINLYRKIDSSECFYSKGAEKPIDKKVKELAMELNITSPNLIQDLKKVMTTEVGMVQKVKEFIYRWREKETYLKYYIH